MNTFSTLICIKTNTLYTDCDTLTLVSDYCIKLGYHCELCRVISKSTEKSNVVDSRTKVFIIKSVTKKYPPIVFKIV